MLFPKEDLVELAGGCSFDDYTIIEDTIIDNSRWTIDHRLIFKYKDKFYKSIYSEGATEQQYQGPYEYEKDPVECKEVHPVKKTITVYE